MAARFHKKNILIIGLGMIGLVVFLRFNGEVNPTASVRLKVSKSQALQIARQFLEAQGFNLEGYDQTAIFAEDNPAYLQRTLGMDQFNKIAPELPLMDWEVEFLKEHQRGGFFVSVGPQGGITSFTHDVPGDAEGASLKQDQALALVKAFIQKQMNIDLSKYRLVNSYINKKERRIDHHFKWETATPFLGNAKLLMTAGVSGDMVNQYAQRIEDPEQFTKTYAQDRSKGEFISKVSHEFSFLLIWTAIVIAVITNKDKIMPWKGASLLAFAVVIAGLLQDINSPDPSFSSLQFPTYLRWGEWILETVESNLSFGIKTFVVAIAGWVVCKEVFTKKRLDLITGFRDLLSRDFARASFMGYMLAAIVLGYVTVFYLIGHNYMDVWNPIGSNYPNFLNTWFPFLDPLTQALQASVFEELVFRFFAIALLIKYLRSRTLALFIPALIWGFGHSFYEVFPIYTRGIELTLIGLVYGYFFIRYGLVTVVVGHFLYDGVIMGIPLLQSTDHYLFWSGIAAAVVLAMLMMLGMIGTIREWRFARTRETTQVQVSMELDKKGPIDEKRIPH
jgi:Type II CAAX prenyl endopeptidase Rce1-like